MKRGKIKTAREAGHRPQPFLKGCGQGLQGQINDPPGASKPLVISLTLQLYVYMQVQFEQEEVDLYNSLLESHFHEQLTGAAHSRAVLARPL